MRRAQVQVQFTWIFSLFAGALILLFFITFILRQKDVSERGLSAKVSAKLDAVLTLAQSSLQTSNNVTIPGDLGFDCTGFVYGGARRPYGNALVFAPGLIQGKLLITYADGWDVPYRASNLLYLTSPRVRYIFLNNSETVHSLFEAMPDAATKQSVEWNITLMASIMPRNDDYVRIILGASSSTLPSYLPGLDALSPEEVGVLGVSRSVSETDAFTVTFYTRNPGAPVMYSPGEVFGVVGEEMALAAVYSSAELFNCTYSRALDHLEHITAVYYQRSRDLLASYRGPGTCAQLYGAAGSSLSAIRREAQRPPTLMSAEAIAANMTALADANQRLKLFSCPTVY